MSGHSISDPKPLPRCDPKRILLVRLSHLGDACHALAVFHALREAFPKAEIWWALQPEFAGLVDNLAGLQGVLPFDRRGGAAAWPRLRKRARAIGFDLAVDAQGNWKSAFVARFSGAKLRLGLAPKDWREPGARRLANHYAAPALGPHAMHKMQALTQALHPGGSLRWDLPLTPEERELGRGLLERSLPKENRARRILHLGAPEDPRSWPAKHFAELARGLASAGESVLCLSGPSEAEAGRSLQKDLSSTVHVHHLVDQRGLRALAGLFAAAAEQNLRLVACDSGPSHVAAAVGLGVDLLVGPTDPARTGPWSDPEKPPLHRALRKNPLDLLGPQGVLDWLLQGAPNVSGPVGITPPQDPLPG